MSRLLHLFIIVIVIFSLSLTTQAAEMHPNDIEATKPEVSLEWWMDAIMRSVEIGSGEPHILENYVPKKSDPLVSFSAPYDLKSLDECSMSHPLGENTKTCPNCKNEMIYVDILYEISQNCGHGIFSYGYYCATDSIFIPDKFYDQCGCWSLGITFPHNYLDFTHEYLS